MTNAVAFKRGTIYSVTGLEYCIFEKLEGINKRYRVWRSRSMLDSIAKFLG
jgi:hypothetical protein